MAFVVRRGRQALRPPAPAGPRAHVLGGLPHGHDQPPQPPPNLGHAQREVRPRLALNTARLLRTRGGRRFFTASPAMAPAHSPTSRASAHLARVITFSSSLQGPTVASFFRS